MPCRQPWSKVHIKLVERKCLSCFETYAIMFFHFSCSFFLFFDILYKLIQRIYRIKINCKIYLCKLKLVYSGQMQQLILNFQAIFASLPQNAGRCNLVLVKYFIYYSDLHIMYNCAVIIIQILTNQWYIYIWHPAHWTYRSLLITPTILVHHG